MKHAGPENKVKRKPTGAAVMRSDLTAALFHAFFEDWADNGYAAISLERVASRAGAGKAAIYRRWESKLEFASEAIAAAEVALTSFADHGSLPADILAYLLATRRALRHRLVCRILPDLIAERMRSSELRPIVDRLSLSRRRVGVIILERAIERGELPAALDRELAMDIIPSPLYWRMVVLGKAVDTAAVHKQAHAVFAALKAC